MSDKYKDNDFIHCYPGTDVLINKLGIRKSKELFRVERELVSFRLAELNDKPIKGSFDLEHLKKIHAYLFQDVYEWAGKVRNYNISKPGTMFCISDYILPYAASIFSKLHDEHFYIDYDYDTKLLKLVTIFSDINALHPFREGNGRTQRVFIEWLAKIAGISLDLTSVTKVEMALASFDGMRGKYDHLFEIFKEHSHSISRSVQLANIQRLLADKDKKLIVGLLDKAPQKKIKM